MECARDEIRTCWGECSENRGRMESSSDGDVKHRMISVVQVKADLGRAEHQKGN